MLSLHKMLPMNEHVLVLGASLKPFRHSHIAVKTLIGHNYEVTAVGIREGIISGVPVQQNVPAALEKIDTVTLYLGAPNQKDYYNDILRLKPRRIIFNPGTENVELYQLARENGIQTIEGCTIFMVNQGNF